MEKIKTRSQNQMTMIYKNNKNNNGMIKLIDDKFIAKNKNRCSLIINNKLHYLCQYYYIDKEEQNLQSFKIILIENKTIYNMSYLFYKCED